MERDSEVMKNERFERVPTLSSYDWALPMSGPYSARVENFKLLPESDLLWRFALFDVA
jgi:hypothetical protein